MSKPIPLFKVFMPQSVLEPLGRVLQSGYITQGPQVEKFEEKLRSFLQYPFLATVNTGTSGLHLALRLNNIKPGDKILSTPLTCTATNWPIILAGGQIDWCDVDTETCNISPSDIASKITEETKAIIIVHWGGTACDLEKIEQIAQEYKVPIIEDCAHAFGSKYGNKMVGSSGNYCCFSFQAIKHLTTIDGGVITVPKMAEKRAKLLRWYGIDREEKGRKDFRCESDIPEVGDKLHMNDVAATIGIEQMNYIEDTLAKHRSNAQYYFSNLQNIPGLTLLNNDPGSAWWIFTVKVENRAGFMAMLKEKGITTSQVHERNDRHTCMKKFKIELPGLESISSKIVSIPVGWWVDSEDREYLVDTIKEGW
jgi:dTDP-4-amino-4,6-dideoxygalactose transaminase